MISEKEIQELPPISGVGKLNSGGPHEGGADAGNLGRPADERLKAADLHLRRELWSQVASIAAQLQAAQSQPVQVASASAPSTASQAFGTAFGVAFAAALALGIVYLAARQQNLDYAAQMQQENLNYMAATRQVRCSSKWVGYCWMTNCN